MRNPAIRFVAFTTLLLLALAACGDDPETLESAAPASQPATATETAPTSVPTTEPMDLPPEATEQPVEEPAVEEPEQPTEVPAGEGESPGLGGAISTPPDDTPGAPGEGGGWTRLTPRNDLSGEQSVAPEEIVVAPSGEALWVRFWGGVEPCFGARAEVTESPDLIEVHLITGLPPGAEVTTCIALAVPYEIEVPLAAPIGGRQILSTFEAPAPGQPNEPQPGDGAVFETAQYLGLTLTEAEELASIEGRVLRVARIDDESFPLTMDFSPSRVNVEIEDDIIVLADAG